MMILSYMGWNTFPIARLDGSKDTKRVLDDMHRHNVYTDFITTNEDGKTPVIVQRNFVNKDGVTTHKFESRNKIERFYLDFKPLTVKQANAVIDRIDYVPKVFFFDRVAPAIIKLAIAFKEKGSIIFFEPSSRGGDAKMFNKCIEIADIVKFSDQRINETDQFGGLSNKLFIQTQGAKGLSYRFNSEWTHLESVLNQKVVDTAGAGDWTAAALINVLFKDKVIQGIAHFSKAEIETALNKAQEIGSKSCSYEGARGMMQLLSRDSLG